jgi:hypothetical protein
MMRGVAAIEPNEMPIPPAGTSPVARFDANAIRAVVEPGTDSSRSADSGISSFFFVLQDFDAIPAPSCVHVLLTWPPSSPSVQ